MILSKIPTGMVMKQELPIAIALLATGVLLWLSNSASTSGAQDSGTTTSSSSTQAARKSASNVALPASVKRKAKPNQKPQKNQNPQAVTGQDSNFVGDPRANQILLQLATQLRDGPPRQGQLSIHSQLFDKPTQIHGRFWQLGQSSLKSRIELIPDSPLPTKTTHLCDGRFCYRLTETKDKQKLAFFDISTLEETTPIKAGHWIPTASLDRLFSFLGSSFKFRIHSSPNDPSALELAGTWVPEDLAKLMINHVDHRLIIPEIQYHKLPPQMPHAVRVRLKQDLMHRDQWAPVAVEFLQIDSDSETQLNTVMSIAFDSIQPGINDPSLFRMDDVTGRSADISPRYLDRFKVIFGNQRVAEQNAAEAR